MKLKKICCFFLSFLVLCSLASAPIVSHASSRSEINPFFFLHSYNTIIEKMLGGKAEYPVDSDISNGEGYCATEWDGITITFAGGEGEKCEIKKIIIKGIDNIDVRAAAAWMVFKFVETPRWMDELDEEKLSNEINNAVKKILNSTKINPYKLFGYNFYYIYPTSKSKGGVAIENQKYCSEEKATEKPTQKPTAEPTIEPNPTPNKYPLPDDNQDFLVSKEFLYKSRDIYYLGVVVKNNSGKSSAVEADIMLYNDKDELVGIKKVEKQIVADGHEVYLECSNGQEFAYAKYFIDAEKPSSSYSEGNTSINLTYEVTDGKIFLFANNVGTKTVRFLNYDCITMKDGEVVGHWDGYLVDKKSEIKPGKTEMEELYYSRAFDEIYVYYDCRID